MTLPIGRSQFFIPDDHARGQPSRQPLLICAAKSETFEAVLIPDSSEPTATVLRAYLHGAKGFSNQLPLRYGPTHTQRLSGFGHCVIRLEAVVNNGVWIVGAGSGEQLRCDHYRREQIDKGYANPHQGARRLLVLER